MTKRRVGIIGYGGIAKRLRTRLETMGHEVRYMLLQETYVTDAASNLRIYPLGEMFKREEFSADVVFLAISTKDKGEAARDYITACTNAGIPVVTAEKGSLAYHAGSVGHHVHENNLKFTAAVSGGVQVLTYIRSRHPNHWRPEIQAVLNGTLNFVFDEVSRGGRTLGEACNEAQRLGYAEPGAKDPLSLLNGELTDVAMKTCVVFNTVLSCGGPYLTPDQLGEFKIDTARLKKLADKAGRYRLVVSFTPVQEGDDYEFFDGHFDRVIGDWRVQGGFRNTYKDTELQSWLPSGVGNAVHIVEGDLGSGGQYTLTGPGAGQEATTTAMINDMLDLRRDGH